MKISVLIPSDAYRSNAGARIRYGRLAPALAAHDIRLNLEVIGQFDPLAADADVLLISKCYDARSLLIAVAAHRRGIPVGVDLFDDYFSQLHDPRLVRFRHWLAEISPCLSFILTSTNMMADVAHRGAPHVPIQVVNDPSEARGGKLQVAEAAAIDAKLERLFAKQRMSLTWFGIGDNPYFPVGLADVSAFAVPLATLGRLTGLAIELSVLTNPRALNAEALACLAGVPVPIRIQEWSEGAEKELLDDSFACFLPVNAQPFSIAKSLNRAISALSHGCQILSLGYPLYAPLDGFIYEGVHRMAADINVGHMRVSAGRRDDLVALLRHWSSAENEAGNLARFLKGIGANRSAPPGLVGLVHGAGSSQSANGLAQMMGDLTIGSPYSPPAIDTDYCANLSLPLRVELSARRQVEGSEKQKIKGRAKLLAKWNSRWGRMSSTSFDSSSVPLSVQLAFYRPVMASMRASLRNDLDVDRVLWSESSPLPFLTHLPRSNS